MHADDLLASVDINGFTDSKNVKFEQIQTDREKVHEEEKLFQCEICCSNFEEKQMLDSTV